MDNATRILRDIQARITSGDITGVVVVYVTGDGQHGYAWCTAPDDRHAHAGLRSELVYALHVSNCFIDAMPSRDVEPKDMPKIMRLVKNNEDNEDNEEKEEEVVEVMCYSAGADGSGHHLRRKDGYGRARVVSTDEAKAVLTKLCTRASVWEYLADSKQDVPQVWTGTGATAVAYARSKFDSRPGAVTIFAALGDNIPAERLLDEAKKQWPEMF